MAVVQSISNGGLGAVNVIDATGHLVGDDHRWRFASGNSAARSCCT